MNLMDAKNKVVNRIYRRTLFIMLFFFVCFIGGGYAIYYFFFDDFDFSMYMASYVAFFFIFFLSLEAHPFWHKTLFDGLRPFHLLFYKKEIGITSCICPHCYGNVFLMSGPDEEWTCNYCNKSFKGDVLAVCPHCKHWQRAFNCSFCGKLIDIYAEYDENKLLKERYARQTELIQQENQSREAAG